MAAVGLLALIDDIAALLDDVALLSKVAARKTAGVLGDDLALNAQQVSGVRAERELPVVWAVAKGSALNKVVLVPAALLISAIAPWLITPLLMLGGAYLCFEGFEKIAHHFLHKKEDDKKTHSETLKAMSDPDVDLVGFEKKKIKGAIRTDFILSAEIVVIALGVVQGAAFSTQVLVVSLIAAVITVGVYGLVAAIVKLDDVGLYLLESGLNENPPTLKSRLSCSLGRGILNFCPYLMKTLSVVGTAAMFLVGGGILVHGMPFLHEPLHHLSAWLMAAMGLSEGFSGVISTCVNGLVGLIAGALLLLVWSLSSGVLKLTRQ